jgi:hypothetical protein
MKSFPAFGIMLRSRGQLVALRELLEKNSGLPGQKANVELAQSFAAAVGAMRLEQWQWDFLVQIAGISPNKAPANTPPEFPVFCGLLALAAHFGQGLPRPRRRSALAALREAALDPRWRVREGAALGLQLIGEADLAVLRGIVEDWLASGLPLLRRAVAVGLAHPPLLADPGFLLFVLETMSALLASVTHAGPKERGEEPFKVLRQGLGSSLGIVVAAAPGEGFALLRKCAAVQDPDMAWIIKENLKKKRLTEGFPRETAQVTAMLGEATAR